MQKKSVLIIGFIFPESKATAAGWRMMKLIELFNKEYVVYFGTPASMSNNSDVLQGVEEVFQLPINSDEVNEVFLKLNPDLVIFDRFLIEEMFGWRIAECLPNTIRILNTEDLHFLRSSRQKWVNVNQKVAATNLLIPFDKEITNRELSSLLRSHLSLIISSAEFQLLTDTFHIPAEKLFVLPLQLPSLTGDLQAVNDKTDFCFIGNGIHNPNEDAIEQLIQHIWPIINQSLPSARLNIACAYTTSKIRQIVSKKKNVQLFEKVEDAHDFVKKHRVQLIPLRYGAGIKGKILETMICQTPFVSTTIGMEGISDTYSFVADDWETFSKLAISLYTDEEAFEEASNQMKEIKKSYPDIDTVFEMLKVRLDIDISKDWYASLLLQQQFNATKFFSKYIIEKNRSITD